MRKSASLLKSVFAALLLFLLSYPSFGQQVTVSGTVTDADKKTPLQGVNVKVIGGTAATETNEKGNFTLKATKGQTLIITHIGFGTQRITAGDGPVTIQLRSEIAEQGEVIVVAMDLKRNPKELGYSVQTVAGKDVKETQRDNFINSLQGRIAGATVTSTSGVPGASSSIVLRGFNSMSLNNQPLFVVDGIIIDNSTMDATANVAAAAGQSNTANDFTNRIADINPNDIESITVLKGPEATVLYGSSASNGAIVITTRKAKIAKGRNVNVFYDNSFRFQMLQRFPNAFNGFSQGSSGVADPTVFKAFGPAYAPGTVLYDNVKNFFQISLGQTHNIGVDFGTPKSNFRFTGSYYYQSGVVPNTSLSKVNFKLTNTTKIGKYIDITPSLSFTNSTNDKALKGAGGYLLNLFIWPATDDAREYLGPNGMKKFIATNSPTEYSPETDNPFFSVNRNESIDKQNRYIATLAININPTKWLNIAGRFGYDHYLTKGFQYYDPQSSAQSSMGNHGSLDNYWTRYSGYNHTISATARQSLGKFNARLTVGTRWNQTETDRYGISGTQDSIHSFDSSATGINTRTRLSRATLYNPGFWNLYKSDQIAGFGEATISYDNVIFLTGSLAFESTSVLPAANRNYNYPGGSLSIIMSDIFPRMKGKVLNFWKLRTSLASTARLPDPYMNQSNFVPTVVNSNYPTPVQYAFLNANPDLKPEKQKTYEAGTELRLFNDIINIDADYYNTLATNQIGQGFRASYGTGFILNTQNNSSVRNQGVEITLGVHAMRKKDFDWNIQFNFNRMWSEVLAIPVPIQLGGGDYYDASTWLYGNARGGLQVGHSTGTITGYGYKRQDLHGVAATGLGSNDGAILVSPLTGLPVIDAIFRVRADRSPKFSLGTINTFRYKNWNLSFLWDMRIGGDIFNGTNEYLTVNGKSLKTTDRLSPRIIKGVVQNGLENTATPTVNTTIVTPYYNSNYYILMPEEEFMEHKINYLRLRDITLSYNMPTSILARDWPGFKSMSFFLTCNDLILFTNYTGADPVTNGGNASLRGVGAAGFDYGNIAAPLSFNAGFRVGF